MDTQMVPSPSALWPSIWKRLSTLETKLSRRVCLSAGLSSATCTPHYACSSYLLPACKGRSLQALACQASSQANLSSLQTEVVSVGSPPRSPLMPACGA